MEGDGALHLSTAGVDEASATCQNAIGLEPGGEMGWPNSHFVYVQTGAKAVT